MAHFYDVQTNHGVVQVSTDYHHDHISKAEFERFLLAAVGNVLGVAARVAGEIIIYRYTHKGSR